MLKKIFIFGLGKFGNALANNLLEQSGIDLELIDKEQNQIDKFKEYNITLHPINTEKKIDIEEIGLGPKDICMVLIGTNIGSSVITVQNLLDLKIENIYVQVINSQHKKIVESLGIKNFIDPNKLAAQKIGFEIAKDLKIIYFEEQNYICRVKNIKIHGKKIDELKLREKHEINLLLIKRPIKENKSQLIQPGPETTIEKNDELILWVPKEKIDKITGIFK